VSVDPVTGFAANAISVGGSPTDIAYDGAALWVTNGNNLERVDPTTSTFTGIISFSTPVNGVIFDGRDIWVTNDGTPAHVVKFIPF
jgi:streptogramin lyase